jgi:cold shock protein
LATGKVLQYDSAHGCGFVAAADGGGDVYLRASVFDGDVEVLGPGLTAESQVTAEDRERIAFAAHPVAGPDTGDPPAAQAAGDVMSPDELSQKLTELLLSAGPELAAQHVVQIRRSLLEWTKRRGWVDG